MVSLKFDLDVYTESITALCAMVIEKKNSLFFKSILI